MKAILKKPIMNWSESSSIAQLDNVEIEGELLERIEKLESEMRKITELLKLTVD